jgi:hypothetical protein
MGRAVLTACVPWLALLVASVVALFLLSRISRARWELGRLRRIHADQVGAVQSLSFVLTLPLFVMIMLLIVQISQLMVAQIVVEYSAVAAARAAVVWIPTYVVDQSGEVEGWNRVHEYQVDGDAENQMPSSTGPTGDGMTYSLTQSGDKYNKIRMAAALACMPISPSRAFSTASPAPAGVLAALENVYAAMVPQSVADSRINDRLRNKLAYTLSPGNLIVDVRFYHSNQELGLGVPWMVQPDVTEFRDNELGWQDPITVNVTYKLALLPGPGRLLATWQQSAAPAANIGGQQGNPGNVFSDTYTYTLSAVATLGNEGEKPNYAHYFPIVNL